ncbi:hypothetical protein X777_08183 [Ooceraea biroi]|uniref:Uncharacterized protein n=1 Tax=Ooceraea biroi TaxID=2015173 RepID=A0A026WYZ1_OOCBI|nr:hypothetical protein X777_08183 [Ooceraea biroi]
MSAETIRLREALDPPRSNRSSLLGLSSTLRPANFVPVASRPSDERMMQNSRNRLPEGWSSPQSPDELVIQNRGPRKPIVWSPDQDNYKHEHSLLSLSSKDCSPIKSPSTPDAALREKARKRLSLNDSRRSVFTTLKVKRTSLDAVHTREQYNDYLLNGLNGLKHEQLVQLIMDLVYAQEDGELCKDEKLRSAILRKIPVMDIQSSLEKLDALRETVYAVLMLSPDPSDDSTCSHVYVHLDAFQNTLISYGTILLESEHWTLLMQYVLKAWRVTRDLPEWKNQGPCNITRKCYKTLSKFCDEALRRGNFEMSDLNVYIESLETIVKECKDFQACLQLAKEARGCD